MEMRAVLAKLGGAIKCGNTEGVLREAWEGAGVRVTFMERRVMYTVIRPGVDRTTWSTGGGSTYAFSRNSGATQLRGWGHDTGPSAGYGGSGYYYYAEASCWSCTGRLFTLAYDGSACSASGQVVATVAFHYHMYGSDMGELRLVDAEGRVDWSLSGNQGSGWQLASVPVHSSSCAFRWRLAVVGVSHHLQ